MSIQTNNQNNRNRTNRRRNSSRRNYPRFGSTIPNLIYANNFPQEMKVCLNYSDFQSYTGSAGLNNDKMFRLNSINDPDLSGVGHRPMSYDLWKLSYNRYRVDAVDVEFTVPYCSADSAVVSVLANNSTTAITVPNVLLESSLAKTRYYSKGGPAVTIRMHVNLANLNGVTRATYNADDRYSAPFGSDPTENLILHASWYDPAGNAVVINSITKLCYKTTLFDPIQQALS
jgi:hypothetical protein